MTRERSEVGYSTPAILLHTEVDDNHQQKSTTKWLFILNPALPG